MKNLTLIIPAKMEKESLPEVLYEIEKFNYHVKIILEKSDDETIKAVENFNHEIIFQAEKGYGNALISGINNCETKYFCIFNADGSFNPKEIEPMINKLENENLDFVFASRYQKNSGSDDDTLITYIGNFIFTLIGKIFFKLNITDILYTFVIGKTEKARQLKLNQKDFRFCVELPIKAQRNLMNMSSSNSFERKRIDGKKKVNAFRDGFFILKHLIYLFFNKN